MESVDRLNEKVNRINKLKEDNNWDFKKNYNKWKVKEKNAWFSFRIYRYLLWWW